MYVCPGCPTSIFLQMYRYVDLSGQSERKPSVPFSLVEMTHSEFSCLVLSAWLAVQVLLLFGQQKFGARFFIPAIFFPPKYNYRRPIPRHLFVTDMPHSSSSSTNSAATGGSVSGSGGLSSDSVSHVWATLSRAVSGAREWLSSSSSSPSDDRGHDADVELQALLRDSEVRSGSAVADDEESAASSLECIICYTGIPRNSHTHMVTIYRIGLFSAIDFLCGCEMYRFMKCMYVSQITPCDHVFHDGCLSQWLAVKLECPVCRAALPDPD